MSDAVVFLFFFPPFMTLARLFVEIKIYECDNDPRKMPPAWLK